MMSTKKEMWFMCLLMQDATPKPDVQATLTDIPKYPENQPVDQTSNKNQQKQDNSAEKYSRQRRISNPNVDTSPVHLRYIAILIF